MSVFLFFTQIALKTEKPLEVTKKFVSGEISIDTRENLTSLGTSLKEHSHRWKYSFCGIRKSRMIIEESSIRKRRVYLNVLYDCISLCTLSYLLNHVSRMNYASYTH